MFDKIKESIYNNGFKLVMVLVVLFLDWFVMGCLSAIVPSVSKVLYSAANIIPWIVILMVNFSKRVEVVVEENMVKYE